MANPDLYSRGKERKNCRSGRERRVDNFRKDLNLVNTISDFQRALSLTEEIKRCIRYQQLLWLPDRLSETRTLLISIRLNTPGLSPEESEKFQNAIVNFQLLEKKFDAHLSKGEPVKSIANINSSISADADSLQEILSKLRKTIGD